MIHFCLNCGKELSDHQYICPICHHNVYLDSIDDKMVNAAAGTLTAANIELNTQWAKYRCGRDGSTGHGFAAEDANAIDDVFSFKDVANSGRNNHKDGSDRIVDGTPIQTKYCATAPKTVNAAFSDNGTGSYRYMSDGKIQILEVPSDQYGSCIELMQEKIRAGKVEGVSDPNMAKDIVKKGNYTYAQARNMAKAGNIDSLLLDAKTGTIVALSSFGISFCIKLAISATSCRNLDDLKDAIQLAFLEGIKNGTITLASSILSMQVLRTTFGQNLIAIATRASEGCVDFVYQYGAGKKIVQDIASGIFAQQLAKDSALDSVVKFIRVNTLTSVAVFVVSSIPDTYRYFVSRSISKPQFIKNLVVNGSSITGATVGAILGAKYGKPGMAIGGLVGGIASGYLSKIVANTICKDDAEHMHELLKIALLELSNEHLIQSQESFENVIRYIEIDKVIDTDLLRVMYTVGADDNNDAIRVDLAKSFLDYYFGIEDRNKKRLKLHDNEQVILDSINSIAV